MTPGPLLRRWEALSAGAQAAVAFPVAFGVMLVFHLGLFPRLSFGLSAGYAVFWGAILTALVVVASRAERARRTHDERTQQGGDDS